MDVLTVKGNIGYIFNYIATGYQSYYHHLPLIQQIIDSFDFLDYKNPQLGISIQYPSTWLRKDANIIGFTSTPLNIYNDSVLFYPRFKSENSSNDLQSTTDYVCGLI